MASEYTYDEDGETWPIFVMAVLSFILLPVTIQWVYRATGRNDALSFNEQIRGAITRGAATLGLENAPAVLKFQRKQRSFKVLNKTLVFVVLGWALVVYIARHHTVETQLIGAFDPYGILDISAFASEREIKSRFRKLSVTAHPDKFPQGLSDEVKQEMETAWIQIQLAYKALTDEVTRNNFLKYGHPDGPQEVSHGIAIPKFLVEGKYSPVMVVIYFVLIGGVLPLLVGSWWNNVKTHTKRGLHVQTAALFARKLADRSPTQVVTPYELLNWICGSEEIKTIARTLSTQGGATVAAAAAAAPPGVPADAAQLHTGNLVVKDLISRHLFRNFELSAKEPQYEQQKLQIVAQLPKLIEGLIEIAAVVRQTEVVLVAGELQKCIVQGVPPIGKYQELLQLPYVDAKAVQSQQAVKKLGKLLTLSAADQKRVLGISDDAKLAAALDVAAHIPTVRILDASFIVPGENQGEGGLPQGSVPPSANAHVSLKFVIKSPRHKSCPKVKPADLLDNETIEYMKSPVAYTNDAQPALPYTYAPYFPGALRNQWSGVLISQRDNKIIEGSSVVAMENVSLANLELSKDQFIAGEGITISAFKIALTTPTPSAEGDYFFRLVLKNNGYFGCDVDIPIKMTVATPTIPTKAIMTKRVKKFMNITGDAAAADDEDDDDDTDYSGSDISDPEEDSLAGALAALRGGNVKKSADADADADDDEDDDDAGSVFTDINTDTEDEAEDEKK